MIHKNMPAASSAVGSTPKPGSQESQPAEEGFNPVDWIADGYKRVFGEGDWTPPGPKGQILAAIAAKQKEISGDS